MTPTRRSKRTDVFAELSTVLGNKLRPPFGVILGAPLEAAELIARLPSGPITCYQLDLHQAQRLRDELKERKLEARVETSPDLWDLPAEFQTLLFPVAQGGERALKLDMVEQSAHILAPGGTLAVLSPYERDEFLPRALKKVFGKVHSPMGTGNAVFWCPQHTPKGRRRHEVAFQVRVEEERSLRFVSRPGVFSYGRFDDGARALVEVADIEAGDRILDLGCGVGTNGILAVQRAGPEGFAGFIDSNVRAVALAELNAAALGVPSFRAVASADARGFPDASFDAVLANPPYYAQLSIAQLFIQRGQALLGPGGRFFLVTKQVEGVYTLMVETFGEPEMFERRGYIVFRAERA